jgi:hypothetical protein
METSIVLFPFNEDAGVDSPLLTTTTAATPEQVVAMTKLMGNLSIHTIAPSYQP